MVPAVVGRYEYYIHDPCKEGARVLVLRVGKKNGVSPAFWIFFVIDLHCSHSFFEKIQLHALQVIVCYKRKRKAYSYIASNGIFRMGKGLRSKAKRKNRNEFRKTIGQVRKLCAFRAFTNDVTKK